MDDTLTAVCILDVVAPPMSSGCVMFRFFISLATVTISSSEGVMRPDNPMTSTLSRCASSRIFSKGTITPKSYTLKLLQPSTTATMFFPMSCTSPLTVAIRKVPAKADVSSGLTASGSFPSAIIFARFSLSMKGSRYATAFFITRADLITCGRNILPEPNKSPTVFMPLISGPSITCAGGWGAWM